MAIIEVGFDRCYGSLYDRGMMDSYYGRGRQPHFYPSGQSYQGERVTDLNPEQIAEYNAGFDYNEFELRDFKDWGCDFTGW